MDSAPEVESVSKCTSCMLMLGQGPCRDCRHEQTKAEVKRLRERLEERAFAAESLSTVMAEKLLPELRALRVENEQLRRELARVRPA